MIVFSYRIENFILSILFYQNNLKPFSNFKLLMSLLINVTKNLTAYITRFGFLICHYTF